MRNVQVCLYVLSGTRMSFQAASLPRPPAGALGSCGKLLVPPGLDTCCCWPCGRAIVVTNRRPLIQQLAYTSHCTTNACRRCPTHDIGGIGPITRSAEKRRRCRRRAEPKKR